MTTEIRITIWNEFRHEKSDEAVKAVYPLGMHTEMYGERFDIPEPDKVIFISWFEGGEVFRSGCTWERGNGRMFYFRPGHETYPTYKDPTIIRVITNACRWAKPRIVQSTSDCPNISNTLEKIHPR